VTEPAKKTVYNLGCGEPGIGGLPALFAAWRQVRVDIDPGSRPDIVADITDLRPIESATADAIWTAHCLEHLFIHAVPLALAEIGRVLNDEGFACIVVPDVQRIAALIAEDRMHETLYVSAAGPITPHDVVFGYGPAIARGHLSMAHRCGFTPTVLMQHLNAAGFGGYVVLRRANYELAAIIRKREWASPADRDELLVALNL
jgi:SAM-dependent methyltransferase